MSEIICLIKFGKKQHLEDLINNGILRFSPIKSFRDSEQKEQGDIFEGAFNIINEEFSKIEVKHPTLGNHTFKPVPKRLGRISQYNEDSFCLFSSYAITLDTFNNKDNHTIDHKMLEFGEYALFIKEPYEFLNRIYQELNLLNINFKSNLADYIDLSKRGDIDLSFFNKTDELSHQLEHRILIKSDDEPKYIQIGSLKEFCDISTATDMIKTKFQAKRNSN
jgi:hypothetical protein